MIKKPALFCRPFHRNSKFVPLPSKSILSNSAEDTAHVSKVGCSVRQFIRHENRGTTNSEGVHHVILVSSPLVYFIRFVESFESLGEAHVTIMNETESLLEKHTHQFVFGEWNIETDILFL